MKKKNIFFLLLLFIFLSLLFAFVRERLIPFNADDKRRTFLLTGDEPAYFLAAYSLAHDGDMNIRNNVIDKSWKSFQNRRVCGTRKGSFEYFVNLSPAMKYSDRAKWKDKQVIVYRPATSIIIAPAAWSEKRIRWWAYTIISTFAITGIIIIIFSAQRAGIPMNWALLFSLSFILSPPSFFYMNQAFPEITVAVILCLSTVLLFLRLLLHHCSQ